MSAWGMGSHAFLALARKELRQLAPLWVTLACLHGVDLFVEHVLSPPHARSWQELSWLSRSSAVEEGFAGLAIAVIAAYNLMPGEHAQGTIRFLYTLPVSRRRIFMTKAIVAAAVLLLNNIVGTLVSASVMIVWQDSFIRRQANVATALAELTLESLYIMICLCHGLLISFFRRLGWLILAAALAVLLALEAVSSRLSILSPVSLFEIAHHGTRPIIPWSAWLLHTTLAVASFTLAMWLWLYRDESFAPVRARFSSGTRVSRLGFGALALFAALGSGVAFKVNDKPDATTPNVAARETLAMLDTEHYRFSYRPPDEAKVHELARQADDVYERVRGWLGGKFSRALVVDLTYEGIEHAGRTSATKISMDVDVSPAVRLRTLRHETIHAVANALSEEVPPGVGPRGRFLAEAIADYGEHVLAPDPVRREQSRLIAALARSRFNIEFKTLLDTDTFLERHDEFLLYAFGEVWVAALVQTCGDDAVARLVSSFAAPGLPRAAEPIVQWRHVMQRMSCDLDLVLARYEETLARLEPQTHAVPVARARLLGSMGSVEGEEGDEGSAGDRVNEDGPGLVFDVEVEATGPGPWSVLLKVRETSETPLHLIRTGRLLVGPSKRGRLTVPGQTDWIEGFDFQVGARAASEGAFFHSRWQTVVR